MMDMYEKFMGTCKNEDDDKMKERALAFATLITVPAKNQSIIKSWEERGRRGQSHVINFEVKLL